MQTTEERLLALEARVEALSAQEAIRACLYRYCRGIDRCDEAALCSTYWPDATDRHGPYSGSANGFINWALAKIRESGRVIHTLGNISIELRGTEAAVESYFQAFQTDIDALGQERATFLIGRYVDRFERRGAGEWRVAARTVVYDWIRESPVPIGSEAERFGVRQPNGGRFPEDPWYALSASLPR